MELTAHLAESLTSHFSLETWFLRPLGIVEIGEEKPKSRLNLSWEQISNCRHYLTMKSTPRKHSHAESLNYEE